MSDAPHNRIPQEAIIPDFDQTHKLLDAMFEPGDLIEVRPIESWKADNGRRDFKVAPSIWVTAGNVAEILPQLADLNEQGFNVYFGVCPRASKGGTKASVKLVRTLWADLDDCRPTEAITRIRGARLPAANAVVDSGHGVHLYWRLGEPFEIRTDVDRARVEQVVKEIAGLIGGDAVQDVSRLLRLPGFANMKGRRNGRPPTPCSIFRTDDDRVFESLEHAITWLPEAAQCRIDAVGDTAPAPDPPTNGKAIPHGLRTWAVRKLGEQVDDRSSRDHAVCARLFERGCSRSAVADLVESTSKFQGRADYLKSTLDAAEASAARDFHNGRDSAPRPWVPFPTDLLPKVLRRFIEETADALGCDRAMLALPVLAVAAGAIGTSRRLRLKSTWFEYPILWTGIVARSGTLKSPAFDHAVAQLWRIQSKATKAFDDAMGRHEAETAKHKLALATWKADNRDNPSPPDPPRAPDPPKLRRYVVSDTTIEALGMILAENPRGVLLARDELSAWLKSFNQYKSRGSDEAAWLELHRAGPLVIDRKTGPRPVQIIPRAAVSICGTIQPGILDHALTDEHFDSGLAGRFLFARPPQGRKHWTDAVPSAFVVEAYETLILRLTELEHRENEPITLQFTDDARESWASWYDRHAERIDAAEGDREAAVLSKIEAAAARLALIFALVEDFAAERVDVHSVEAACKLADWFADEAARLYAAMGTTEDRGDRTLLGWIERRGGRVTVREVTHGVWKYKGKGDKAREALDRLVEAGHGQWTAPPPGPQGGAPQRVFERIPTSPHPHNPPPEAAIEGYGDGDAR